jgi:putative ABC transport system ATP-binding protein
MSDDIIRLVDVSKFYKTGDSKFVAVNSVSLDIPRGSMFVITGPSGSGKSTLLYLMAGLMNPTHGEVFINEESIYKLQDSNISKLRKETIGFVFQAFNLIPSLTALENVIASRIMDQDKQQEKAYDLLDNLGLSSHKDHLPSELSGGEQQRVAIARALLNDPDIMLADEPTGNLDSKNGEIIIKILHELNSKGKTVIVTTHNPKLFMAEGVQHISILDGCIDVKTGANAYGQI